MSESASVTTLTEEATEFTAQTIDITSWFNTDLSTSGSFDMGIMAADYFGKLLDVLAVPALLIDWSYTVVFANQSCGRFAANFKSIEGVPFSSLVPRTANAEKAQTLIRKVFRSRRPQVAEGILELDARKIWGRLYFRSVRVGSERFVLLLIENMTNEKTQLLLSQRQLEKTGKLVVQADDRLRREMNEHGKTREALRTEKQRFEALSELVPGGCAIIKNDGSIKQASSKFRELFNIDGEGEPTCKRQELLEWLRDLDDPQNRTPEATLFHIEAPDGTLRKIKCSASRIKTGQFMLFCEDHPEELPGK
ncbi:MAG: PAS domain-containing protein [Desulfomonile tiedjei]|uniref:PAS domain-containing protein n=1 Tax=Desulfomonile tiedjei TaxID=2358 RepID=A0A9D6V781_9BACT|nr:PAS domain-containing protein [Desulfomonile tiedjei]